MVEVKQYAAQYELLRAQVVGASPGEHAPDQGLTGCGRGVGFALLLREGLPGWLRAVRALRQAMPEADSRMVGVVEPGQTLQATGTSATAPTHHHEMAILLASLVLSTRHSPQRSPHDAGARACR